MRLPEILKRTVITIGSGGVGKTTVSAALALHAALEGARSLVLTVDPARRLANSLGLESFSEEQRRIDLAPMRGQGRNARGSLDAAMLDTKSTFDRIIARYAPSPEVRDRILKNPYYRQASSTLAGSEDYMAMERLHEIREDHENGYDFVVLDTPPSSHALDFLRAPARLLGAMDNRNVRAFVSSMGAVGRTGRVGGRMNRFLVKRVGRFLGAEVFLQILAFLDSFSSMYDGFAERSRSVESFLRSDELAFLIVTAPERSALEEALFLRTTLEQNGMPFGAFVVNRVHLPYLPEDDGEGARGATSLTDQRLEQHFARALSQSTSQVTEERARQIAARVVARRRDMHALVERDRANLDLLRAEVGDEHILLVPHFPEDIHDLHGLRRFARVLMAAARPRPAGVVEQPGQIE